MAAVSLSASLLNWGLGLIFSGLLVLALASRRELRPGLLVSDQIAHAFVSFTTQHVYPLAIGIYSAVLGFFVPSGGGKWLPEAPYLMQAANDLHVHLGWAVQNYNAAEVMPNLINPFWMLPLLGVLGLRARNLVGFTFLQLLMMLPWCCFCYGPWRTRSNIIHPRCPECACEVPRAIVRFIAATKQARRRLH